MVGFCLHFELKFGPFTKPKIYSQAHQLSGIILKLAVQFSTSMMNMLHKVTAGGLGSACCIYTHQYTICIYKIYIHFPPLLRGPFRCTWPIVDDVFEPEQLRPGNGTSREWVNKMKGFSAEMFICVCECVRVSVCLANLPTAGVKWAWNVRLEFSDAFKCRLAEKTKGFTAAASSAVESWVIN